MMNEVGEALEELCARRFSCLSAFTMQGSRTHLAQCDGLQESHGYGAQDFFACIAFICSGTCSISRFYVHFLYPLFAVKIQALI